MPAKKNPQLAFRRLAKGYGKQGYVRGSPDRRAQPRTHRGYEVRFIAHSAAERDEIVALLREAGEAPGKPFATGKAWRIPVYGEEAAARLAAGLSLTARKGKRAGQRRK